MCKMAVIRDWHISYPPTHKFMNLRPHSSPCRVYSRNGFQRVFRPSSTTAMANPILSFLDVKRILFQKITDKGDELRKAFQLLDTNHNMTVSKSELKRIITTFLMPLTREQFQDVLAQIPLTSSGAVPYLEFLSGFSGMDLHINVIKRGGGNEMHCSRTVKELEIQVGEKIFKNMKTVIKAFKLIDVNKTGLVQPHELRKVLETFCLKMKGDEYKKFAKHYNIDKDTTVDYNVFLKNLSVNNDLNLRYKTGNPEVSWESQSVKNSKRECPHSSVSSEEVWKNCSLEEVETAFCQELSKSYGKVEKALSAGDPSKSGCVSLNYLKIVFDTFVYRLPRRIFIQLMKRFGLKTTARVNWKQFLTSFYESQWLEVNNTVPPTERNSITSKNQSCEENIIPKLSRHEGHSASLKKALLNAKTKPDGRITGEELRHILNCEVVKISDSEFKQLMQTLDPGGTGWVNVNTFIQLLEENPEVEEIVHDSITRNLQAFYKMLQAYDLGDTGLIGQNNFKKIMHIFCPFLTAERLLKLCSKFQDITSGRILYKELLARVGISGPPTISPALVPKDQVFGEHFHKEEQQQPDLPERTKPTGDKSTLTKKTTKEEVIEKHKRCIQQQDPAFRKIFLDFSKEPAGKVNVHDFKKVPGNRGMPVDDDQYAPLTAEVGHEKGGTSYLDLAAGLGDARRNGPEGAPSQTPVLSKSNLDGYFVTAEECVKRFPQRLKEAFRDPYSAFFKIDTDRDGIIHTRDVHRLLRLLLFNLKDDEFERFLGLLGLRLGVTLNFREFRNLCEKTSLRTDDPPQRLIGPKQKVADSELACEQAHQYLATKAKTRWSDLSKNFIETDSEGNGILRRRDIKNALYGFDIPLTPREFEKLWMSYDTDGRGHITYQEFLQKLGINYSADIHRPYAEDYFNFMGHFTKPQQVHEEARQLQQSPDRAGPARDKLKDHYQDISKALTKVDPSPNGYIPVSKMQEVLRGCGCHLKEEDLADLLNSWGIRWHDNSFNYLDFLKAVENSEPTRPPPREKEGAPLTFATLDPAEVVKSIQEVVDSSNAALSTAFSALDKEDTGFVKASDFGQVLKDFCHKLTDNQYHYFLRKLKIHLSPHINWKYFLQNFDSFSEETAAEWAEKMPQGPPPTTPKETAHQELLARIHKAVGSCYCAIAQEFDNFDTMKTNTASRDEFRALCARHVQVLTDEQFDRLWSEMPVNAKGRLKYLDFLSMFSSERGATPPATGSSAKAQKGCSVPEVSERSRSAASSTPAPDLKAGLKTQSHPCTLASASTADTLPLQNCEPIESKLRRRIQGCWREFLKECEEKDATKQGEITTAEFLALVEKFRLDISKEESQRLAVKYDVKNSGKFAYCDFIQSCVLLLKAKETSLMQRMKIQNANKMKEAGAETSSFYSALLRIQPQIVHCWRPMRRTFKAYDEGGTGLLSVADFRKVLRQHSINLSEEEFFHILEYYDKTLSSKISYNDFLRAFLQ
ncbi:EF-hand calcium-binding domain-containing protein 6 isoform X2 [Acinonyx jubatus]|uniref:EF-hand calcium-binding domain-containing protein 6 isoform X2 n=1 Tax=Acinonyx jubatus TaxID=32536 RepID=A0A6J2ACS9_ACIJB|nr:EF-hand calcium-binding domain-containing protein 6 isoform X2 [Acinonyx jubatus]XP_053082877.1 EF-hand calcium-binding domain-containing protein 6 isoform X2 [Acinonyx jubatus]